MALSKWTKFSRKSIAVFLCLLLVSSAVSAYVAYNVGLTKAQTSSITTNTMTGGTISGAPTWTIYSDSGTVYAKNQWGANSYSSTNFDTVLTDVIANNTSVKIVSGTYYVPDEHGVAIDTISNFALYSDAGAIIKYSYTGTLNAGDQMLRIGHGSSNIIINGLTFDMSWGSGTSNDLVNYGDMWIIEVASYAGEAATHNIYFNNDQFLNSPDCGFNIAAAQNTYINNCYFSNFGEHPIYASDNSAGTYNLNIQFHGDTFYNWAKYVRGYIKIVFSIGTVVDSCIFNPNQDGLGFPTPPPPTFGTGESGAYGLVLYTDNNTKVTNCNLIGNSLVVSNFKYGIDIGGSSRDTMIEGTTVTNWNYINIDSTATYVSMINCYIKDTPFNDQKPMYMSNTKTETAGVVLVQQSSSNSIFDLPSGTGAVGSYPPGSTFTNYGAGGTATFMLPALYNYKVAAGTSYTFVVLTNQYLWVSTYNVSGPVAGIYYQGSLHNAHVSPNGAILYSNEIGDSVTLMENDTNGNWFVTAIQGTWSISG